MRRRGAAREAWRRRALTALAVLALTALPGLPVAADSALPATLDPAAPFIVAQEVVVLVPQGPAVRVDELVSGVNRSAKPVLGLTFPLPPEAVGVALQGGAAPSTFTVAGGAAHLALTVPPGGTGAYGFTFTLSWAGGQLRLPVAYPTAEFTLLLPHGRWRLAAPGFTSGGGTRLAKDVAMDAYTTLTPTPGALLPVRLAPSGPWARRALRVGLAAVVAFALAALLLRHLRRRQAEGQRTETELVEALAHLDADRQQGLIAAGPYAQSRQRLLQDLEGGHGL